MSEWKSPLTGDVFDLQTLAEFYAEGDPRVEVDDGNFVLVGSSQAADMAAEIRRLLALLDGAARTCRPSHRPVGLHGASPTKKMSVQWTDEAGNQPVTVTPAPIEVRSKLSLARTSVDGVLTPVVPHPSGLQPCPLEQARRSRAAVAWDQANP